ncbi:reverse transcriptase [Tanacetum coccineum]
MPMYIMNIFLLPDNLIDDIHKSLNVYWWGDGVKENPIRWCKRERMCILKFQGGLGFCHLGLFNRSLLAKQAWRLVTSPTTLAARILKARYFPRSSFFDAKIGYRPSYIWRSFLSVKDIVRKGCKWNISNGRSVNVWYDFWVDDHRSLGPKPNNCDVDHVRDLLNLEGDGWNHELLSSLFSHNIASKIACYFVSKSRNDMLYWHNSPGDRFSCRSTYILALEAYEDMNITWQIREKLLLAPTGYITPIRGPEADHIKVNYDVAWQKESGKADVGFVARDYNGDVLFSGARLDYYASSPLEAEAKPVHWAMSHALSRGYSRVTFETDSLCLVKALHNKFILLQIASLFSDILSHSMVFDVYSWSFVKREGNRVAHSIASLALTCSYEITLDGSVPNCANVWMIKDVLLSEME